MTGEAKLLPARYLDTYDAREAHDFGCADSKGRQLGTVVRRGTLNIVPHDDSKPYYGIAARPEDFGHWFIYRVHATRAGEAFGASQTTHKFHSVAEREAAVAKYLKGASLRARKLAAAAA